MQIIALAVLLQGHNLDLHIRSLSLDLNPTKYSSLMSEMCLSLHALSKVSQVSEGYITNNGIMKQHVDRVHET